MCPALGPSWAPLQVGTAKGSLLLAWSEARAAAKGDRTGPSVAEGSAASSAASSGPVVPSWPEAEPSGSECGLLWRGLQPVGKAGTADRRTWIRQQKRLAKQGSLTTTYFQEAWLQAQEAKGSNICPASAAGYSQPLNSKGWPWRAKSLAQGPQQVRGPGLV